MIYYTNLPLEQSYLIFLTQVHVTNNGTGELKWRNNHAVHYDHTYSHLE